MGIFHFGSFRRKRVGHTHYFESGSFIRWIVSLFMILILIEVCWRGGPTTRLSVAPEIRLTRSIHHHIIDRVQDWSEGCAKSVRPKEMQFIYPDFEYNVPGGDNSTDPLHRCKHCNHDSWSWLLDSDADSDSMYIGGAGGAVASFDRLQFDFISRESGDWNRSRMNRSQKSKRLRKRVESIRRNRFANWVDAYIFGPHATIVPTFQAKDVSIPANIAIHSHNNESIHIYTHIMIMVNMNQRIIRWGRNGFTRFRALFMRWWVAIMRSVLLFQDHHFASFTCHK